MSSLEKIVVDTNVFFAGLVSNQGASFAILQYLVAEYEKGHMINCLSTPTVFELEEVLLRPKNIKMTGLTINESHSFIDGIILISHRIKLHYLWRPFLKDKKDDKILELAVVANARYIVTHNISDFIGVEKSFGITPLKPKEYLEIIRKETK